MTSTVTQGELAPRSAGSFAGAVATAVTTTVWVVGCVLDDTADGRANAFAAATTGGTLFDVLVLEVANGAEGSDASFENFADFARRHFERGVTVFFGHKLSGRAGSANHLSAATWGELDAVNESTDRDFGEREAVAGFDRNVFSGFESRTFFHFGVGDDVIINAVLVFNASDTSRTVWVVLDFFDGEFKVGRKIVGQEAIVTLDTATTMANGDATLVVLAGLLFFGEREGF